MWQWLFDCFADTILKEQLHFLQFNFVAQLCSRDFLQGLFTPEPHALSNAQDSSCSPTGRLSGQSLTTLAQDEVLHPPKNMERFATHN